jgi:hypothetical protein
VILVGAGQQFLRILRTGRTEEKSTQGREREERLHTSLDCKETWGIVQSGAGDR